MPRRSVSTRWARPRICRWREVLANVRWRLGHRCRQTPNANDHVSCSSGCRRRHPFSLAGWTMARDLSTAPMPARSHRLAFRMQATPIQTSAIVQALARTGTGANRLATIAACGTHQPSTRAAKPVARACVGISAHCYYPAQQNGAPRSPERSA